MGSWGVNLPMSTFNEREARQAAPALNTVAMEYGRFDKDIKAGETFNPVDLQGYIITPVLIK